MGIRLTLKHGGIGPIEGGTGFKIVEHLVEVGAPNSVRQAVMHLGEQRHAAILEALDEPDLPKGSTRLELVGQQIANQGTEFAGTTRGRDADRADLAVEIEVWIVHPRGPVEAKWNLDQSAQERAEQAFPSLDQGAQPTHVKAARGSRGIKQSHRAYVHVRCCRLAVDETGVRTTEPLHPAPPVLREIVRRCQTRR